MFNNIEFTLKNKSQIYSGAQFFFHREVFGFLLAGNIKIEAESGVFEINKGEFFILDRGYYLVNYCSKMVSLLTLKLPSQFIIENKALIYSKAKSLKNAPVATQKADLATLNELGKIEHNLQVKNKNTKSDRAIINIVKQLFISPGGVSDKLHWYKGLTPSVINFMDDVFDNLDSVINIDFFSKKHEISVFQLIRLFSRHFKLTPTQWITANKMKLAKYLIYTTNLKILEISEKVGYNDTSNFIIKYKKKFNMTPLTERKLKKALLNNETVQK